MGPDFLPIYSSQDEVPFSVHLEYTIDAHKPITTWRNQYLMLENIEHLENATGNFVVDAEKQYVSYPNGFVVQVHDVGQPII